jgi:adenosylcobalamin-dependent ribonucleoside-triphosphate reductase
VKDFKLSEKFLEQYQGQQPKWGFGALSYITYKRTYARVQSDGTTEEFWETVKRVVEGTFSVQKRHCNAFKLPWDNRKAQRSAQIMFEKMWNFKFLPAGRGLWMMGTDAIEEKGSGGLNNCGMVSTNDIDIDLASPFCWSMDFLMLGVGIGFDTEGAGKVVIREPKTNDGQKYVIPDTREGWIEALRLTISAFEKGTAIPDFDFSLIRPIGAPIKTFGGTSSGPEPLMSLLESIKILLTARIDETLTSVDIVDMFNFVGKAVVAGNVRRSAELALGKADDEDFLNCKDHNLFPDEMADRRWASNNSVLAKIGMSYTGPAKRTSLNGEPGYIWLDNARKFGRLKDNLEYKLYKDYRIVGFNPCAEQGLESYELCNLVETFPANHDTAEEYYETLKYAYMYAKTVSLIPTHDPRTNAVMTRNRRIGTSMSGIEQAKKKFGVFNFYNDFCDKGYAVLKEYDKIYSDWLGIAKSIKITTVKPSGTVSLLAGATAGVHAAHAEFYYRTMRIAHNSPIIPALLKAGYRVEYDANEFKKNDKSWQVPIKKLDKEYKGSLVAYFPVAEHDFTKGKEDQTIWEQAENAAKMQWFWSDNSVSVTIVFKKDERPQIETILEHYETRLKTASFLPLADHGYNQAPYQTLTREEYEKAAASLVDIENITQIAQSDKRIEAFCEGDKCTLPESN